MRVSEHKLIFGMFAFVIYMLTAALNIIPKFVSITRPRISESLNSWYNNRKTYVKKDNIGKDLYFCNKLHADRSWFKTDRGILLPNGTIYYCNIPKCGSTFLKILFTKIFSTGKKESLEHAFDVVRKNTNISNVYSFMFVREPYGRVLSAYVDKIFNPLTYFTGKRTHIVREVRTNPSKLSLRLGHDVTFSELVQYIVQHYNQGKMINRHFASMHTLCNPCRQKYDFVGNLETMRPDLAKLINAWISRDLVTIDSETTENLGSAIRYKTLFSSAKSMFMFHEIYKGLISKYKLFQRTWSSYQIRGFIYKYYKLPYSASNVTYVSLNDYNKAVETAMNASNKYTRQLKAQWKEALQQIYGNVPIALLENLSQYFKTDCKLFGYENRPSWIFNQSERTSINYHNYFQWL